jgi:protein-tyrosine phosphatase
MIRKLRHLPDRLLHASRREAARQAAARSGRPVHVVFACHGNLCRSPYAAARALHLLKADPQARVSSAGLVSQGVPSPPEAVRAARERGLDIEGHRSRPLLTELVRGATLLVVMDEAQRRAVTELRGAPPGRVVLLGDFDPKPISTREVTDPLERPVEEFRACYERIDRCVENLVGALPPWRPSSPAARAPRRSMPGPPRR